MRLALKYITLSVLLFFAALSVKATHLVGGHMSYQYLGRLGNGNFQYRVTLKIYRDCAASTVPFDDDITITAYNGSGNRPWASSFTFFKLDERQVDPPRGANCPNAPVVCIREATYSQNIQLPGSNFGYHLVFQRCCRNTQNNIIDDEGQTYYAFIPPTNIKNSSPFFTGVPAPYICRDDTTTYLNAASDPDGDSLTYKLVHPWSGGTSGNPIPVPSNNSNLSLPIPPVKYRNGFNASIPFGVNGLATIDPFNGLTTMLARDEGRFALAVEVTEWRNGQILSTIRLDVQMIVITCQPNKAPNITPTSGGFSRSVTAGQKLCFDVQVSDPDAPLQTVTLKGKGDMFDGTNNWQGPKATLPTKTGVGTVISQFCWTPSCDQARSFPYNFIVDATDDGCPPKSRSVTFTIQVNPFTGVQTITGPTVVCDGDIRMQYSVAFTPGSTYKWTVIGGTFDGPDTGASVKINWNTPGTGRVNVVETSAEGCVGKPANLNVSIAPKPGPNKIAGQDTLCEFSQNQLYQVTPTVGNTYKWIIKGGTIVSQPQPHQVRVNWGGIGVGELAAIEINPAGCPGDTNFKHVAITRAMLDTIYGSPSVCPNLKGVDYYVTPTPGSNYQWFVEGGTLRSGNGTPHIIVDWGDVGIGWVKAIEITKWGCRGDTVRYRVKKEHNLTGIKPIGEDSVCEFTAGLRYEVIFTHGSKYFWTVNGGTIVKNDSTNWILVNWGATGNGEVQVYETSYDSINNVPCIGTPTRLPVVINPLPVADEIKGTFELCQSSGVYTYTLNGFPGSTYTWSIDADTAGIKGQGTNTVSIEWKQFGSFTLKVSEMTKDSCTGTPVDSVVLVNPRPVTTPIAGDSIVCYPQFQNHAYSVTGFATSTYTWWINSGTINSGQGTPNVNTSWSGQQDNLLQVLETSDKGCPGDTIKLNVFADRPVIKMRYVSVGFPSDDRMEIRWELENAPRYNSTFVVQRRIAGVTDSWKNVGTVSGTSFTFTDLKLNTDNNAFEYRIKGTDLCGREVFSDIHTNILLTGSKPDVYEVVVNWTRYQGWTDGVRTYELYRSNDFENSFTLAKDKGSDTTDHFEDGINNFTQRYRIKAYQNGGKQDTSWSNEISFNFDPLLWVPNAFTPNGDNLNNTFKIVYGSIKLFQIDIYDRWGEHLFSTNDITQNWDGTFKGQPCPDGVYIYRLRYAGADNMSKVLTGNITLLR